MYLKVIPFYENACGGKASIFGHEQISRAASPYAEPRLIFVIYAIVK
jgi:hypothetical protein